MEVEDARESRVNVVLNQRPVVSLGKANISADFGFVLSSVKQECTTDFVAHVPKIEYEAVLEESKSDASPFPGKFSYHSSSRQNEIPQVVTEEGHVKQEATFSPHSALSDEDCCLEEHSSIFVKTEESQDSDKLFCPLLGNSLQQNGINVDDAAQIPIVTDCMSALQDGVNEEHEDNASPPGLIISQTANGSLNELPYSPNIYLNRESVLLRDLRTISTDTFPGKYVTKSNIQMKSSVYGKPLGQVQQPLVTINSGVNNPSLRLKSVESMLKKSLTRESCLVNNGSVLGSKDQAGSAAIINKHNYENWATVRSQITEDSLNSTLAGPNETEFRIENQGEIIWFKSENDLESQTETEPRRNVGSLGHLTEISQIKKEPSFESQTETLLRRNEGSLEHRTEISWIKKEPSFESRTETVLRRNEGSLEHQTEISWIQKEPSFESQAESLERQAGSSRSLHKPSPEIQIGACWSMKEKSYTCRSCMSSFTDAATLRRHMEVKHFICPHCSEIFKSARYLQAHLNLVLSNSKSHSCDLCSASFKTFSELQRHHVTSTTDQPLRCPKCPETFFFNVFLDLHAEEHGKKRGRPRKRRHIQPLISLRQVSSIGSLAWNGLNTSACSFQNQTGISSSAKECGLVEQAKISFDTNDSSKNLGEMLTNINKVSSKTSWNMNGSLENCIGSSLKINKLRLQNETMTRNIVRHLEQECSNEKAFSRVLRPRLKTDDLSSHLKTSITSPHSYIGRSQVFSPASGRRRPTGLKKDKRPHVCGLCFKTLGSKTHLAKHLRQVHSPKKPFSCDQCSAQFKMKYLLRQHLVTHSNERPFVCTVCPRAYATAKLLESHLKSHSSERPHHCPLCSKTYKTKGQVTGHMALVHTCKKRHDKRRFACLQCPLIFFQARYLQLHMETHAKKGKCGTAQLLEEDERPFICTLCPASFETAAGIDEHGKTHDEALACTLCPSVFSNAQKLKRHVKIHSNAWHVRHSGQRYSCAICSKIFRNKYDLKKHLQKVHCDEEPIKCEKCPASFKTADSLAQHHRIHTNERSYVCNLCPSAFSDPKTLNGHMKRHSDERPYVCALCSKAFKDKNTIRHHLKHTHSNTKRFCCAHCPARFKTKGNLQTHLGTHTEQCPFSCPSCHSAFSRARHLKLHMETHQTSHIKGSKSVLAKKQTECFSCTLCPHSFKTAGGLSRHRRIHPEDRPFACTECTSFFADSERLKKHMDEHGDGKRYACALCSKTFKRKSGVAKHLQQVHCDERPFSCERCPARFKTVTSLDQHFRSHTNYRPYACAQCSRTFAQPSALKTHMLVHSDAKPYVCALCSKAFKSKMCIRQHLRQVHTDNKPFSCKLCLARFHRNKHLRIHLCPNRLKVVEN